MKSVKFLFLLLLGAFFSSCTHWLIDTETRIQVKNSTNRDIYELSVISPGKRIVLVPDTLKVDESSNVHVISWVGKFKFAIFVKNLPDSVYLGEYELKGGSIKAEIKGEDMALKMVLK